MIERRALETHPFVRQRLQERWHGDSIHRMWSPHEQTGCRVIASGRVELDDLLQCGLAAGVKVRTCELHISEIWSLEHPAHPRRGLWTVSCSGRQKVAERIPRSKARVVVRRFDSCKEKTGVGPEGGVIFRPANRNRRGECQFGLHVTGCTP